MTAKTFDTVPWAKAEELFNLLKNNGIFESQAMASIGYRQSATTLTEARQRGEIRRVIYMALKGLIAERGIGKEPKAEIFALSFDESEVLFDILRRSRANFPKREAEIKALQAKIAQHMTKV